jgi:hypothetical protein
MHMLVNGLDAVQWFVAALAKYAQFKLAAQAPVDIDAYISPILDVPYCSS